MAAGIDNAEGSGVSGGFLFFLPIKTARLPRAQRRRARGIRESLKRVSHKNAGSRGGGLCKIGWLLVL